MSEGFCELFTKQVLLEAVPRAQADADPALRAEVEGTTPDGKPFKEFTSDLVGDYVTPSQYVEYLAHAEGIRDALGAHGDAAVKAAFFQGHVELIGLRPDGTEAPPLAASDQDLVRVPPGVSSVFALSVMTGAPEADIRAANLDKKLSPLPSRVHVPGCRYHRVVGSTDRDVDTNRLRGQKVEGLREISVQNGVTQEALKRANPGVRMDQLKVGDEVLVPVH
jgi:hypothetical protein